MLFFFVLALFPSDFFSSVSSTVSAVPVRGCGLLNCFKSSAKTPKDPAPIHNPIQESQGLYFPENESSTSSIDPDMEQIIIEQELLARSIAKDVSFIENVEVRDKARYMKRITFIQDNILNLGQILYALHTSTHPQEKYMYMAKLELISDELKEFKKMRVKLMDDLNAHAIPFQRKREQLLWIDSSDKIDQLQLESMHGKQKYSNLKIHVPNAYSQGPEWEDQPARNGPTPSISRSRLATPSPPHLYNTMGPKLRSKSSPCLDFQLSSRKHRTARKSPCSSGNHILPKAAVVASYLKKSSENGGGSNGSGSGSSFETLYESAKSNRLYENENMLNHVMNQIVTLEDDIAEWL
jgi:hypothetical protein